MKIFIKKAAKVLAVIALCFVLCFLFVIAARYIEKANTFQYVKNNTQQLTAEAEAVMANSVHAHYQYDDMTLVYFPSANYPIVEFSTDGFGIASAGYYTGFYYSPQDIPVRYNGNGTNMQPYKKGWTYQDIGDNGGYTEKICDNWYWYKFWF